MAQETKKITELTALDSFTTSTLFVTHNGTGARKATMQQLLNYLPNLANMGSATEGARVHNGIYRGKNLGTSVTSAQYDAIGAGTFTDMYIGDYWVIGSKNYRIVAFDYYRRCGDGNNNAAFKWVDGNNVEHTIPILGDVNKHHVTIMPDAPLYNASMNPTNTTDGGYAGSVMYRGTTVYTAPVGTTYYTTSACTTEGGTIETATEVTPVSGGTAGSIVISDTTYYVLLADCTQSYDARSSGLASAKDTVVNAFGDTHILGMRKYLVNAASEGVGTGGGWFDSFLELPNEVNMYGSCIVGAMNSNNINHYKYTVDKTQFPLFRFAPDLISNRQYFWLQDIVTSAFFARVYNNGTANGHNIYSSYGVRPVFSIVKSNALS